MKRYVWVGFLLFLGMFLISAYGENKGEILKTSGKADMTQVASMRSGKAVFDKTCQACHKTGVAGAPIVGDKAAWEPRISKGMETLFNHAWNGYKGMPPKGTCMDCSEQEIKNAIKYMISKSQ